MSRPKGGAEGFSLSRIRRVDRGGVYRAYRDWPSLARKGSEVRFGFPQASFRKACVIGMGGSAAGGDVIAGWLSLRRGVEFAVYKGTVPSREMSGTLAIACSASGQTVETIEMMKTANGNGATVVCISSGGRLEEEAMALGLEHVRTPPILAPRYMLPFMVFSCLSAVGRGLGLGCEDEMGESVGALASQAGTLDVEAPPQRNAAKRLAQKILGRTPAIMGDTVTRGVGVRFKNVMNENAKTHAYFDRMPDLFHNEIEAWEGKDRGFVPVFLRHTAEVPGERRRADAFTSVLQRLGAGPVEVRGEGGAILSQLVTMTYRLDMASYYAAVALGRDPLPTKLIDRLKRSKPG